MWHTRERQAWTQPQCLCSFFWSQPLLGPARTEHLKDILSTSCVLWASSPLTRRWFLSDLAEQIKLFLRLGLNNKNGFTLDKTVALKTKEIAKRTFAEIKHRTRSLCIESQTKEFAHMTKKWDVCIGREEFLENCLCLCVCLECMGWGRWVYYGNCEYLIEVVRPVEYVEEGKEQGK